MNRTFTPIETVYNKIKDTDQDSFIIVVIGAMSCNVCKQQHYELLKLQNQFGYVPFYHINVDEWNTVFPKYAMKSVPMVYKANPTYGMNLISNGFIDFQHIQSKL